LKNKKIFVFAISSKQWFEMILGIMNPMTTARSGWKKLKNWNSKYYCFYSINLLFFWSNHVSRWMLNQICHWQREMIIIGFLIDFLTLCNLQINSITNSRGKWSLDRISWSKVCNNLGVWSKLCFITWSKF
jgi:hypothetical protein